MKQEIKRVTAKLLTLVMLLTLCVVFVPTELESKAATTTTVTYNSYVQSYGWTGWKSNGALSGKIGESKRLEGITIKLKNKTTTGGIKYRTYVQSHGWMPYVTEGKYSGTKGEAKRIESIQIKLTGKMANAYDIYYRAYAQGYGWLGWAKNGATSGTQGLNKRLEGIQIKLVKKGGKAPGSSFKQYLTNKNLDEQLYAELLEEIRVRNMDKLMKDYNFFYFASEFKYFFKDLNGDGIKELILTKVRNDGEHVNDNDVVGIFTLKNNKPMNLYTQTSFAPGTMLENGELLVESFNGAFDVGTRIKLDFNNRFGSGKITTIEGYGYTLDNDGNRSFFAYDSSYIEKMYSEGFDTEAYIQSHQVSEGDIFLWKLGLNYMKIPECKVLKLVELTGN